MEHRLLGPGRAEHPRGPPDRCGRQRVGGDQLQLHAGHGRCRTRGGTRHRLGQQRQRSHHEHRHTRPERCGERCDRRILDRWRLHMEHRLLGPGRAEHPRGPPDRCGRQRVGGDQLQLHAGHGRCGARGGARHRLGQQRQRSRHEHRHTQPQSGRKRCDRRILDRWRLHMEHRLLRTGRAEHARGPPDRRGRQCVGGDQLQLHAGHHRCGTRGGARHRLRQQRQ
ncbi:hypothetical protein LMG27174_07317 [Paraburkholderia rhynchosiae]|uniref:Uncharacterized protein n=1 Tax=Paraburkholderia rhynchosiae TaxID=487049 RepID=A0A6J5CWZ0_9BURK|nr:hypothetical protein LMG27174_07317 [Paraburkholderia rhynchosiae]